MRRIGVLHVSGRRRRGRTSPPRGVGLKQLAGDGRNLRIYTRWATGDAIRHGAKWLELLKEIAPGVSRAAVIWDAAR